MRGEWQKRRRSSRDFALRVAIDTERAPKVTDVWSREANLVAHLTSVRRRDPLRAVTRARPATPVTWTGGGYTRCVSGRSNGRQVTGQERAGCRATKSGTGYNPPGDEMTAVIYLLHSERSSHHAPLLRYTDKP